MDELCIRHNLAGRFGENLDRSEQIVFFKNRRHHSLKETGCRLRTISARPGDGKTRVQRRQHRGQIGSWIGVRYIPADRSAVPHRRIADLRRGFRQRRALPHDRGRRGEFSVCCQCSNSNYTLAHRDPFQLVDPADVDDDRRRCQPQFQQRDQAVAAGKELGARIFAKKAAGFGNRARTVIIKFRCVHSSPPGLNGLPHALGCKGHVYRFNAEWAERIEHSVIDGGGRCNSAGFADAFDTKRMVRRRSHCG